MKKCSHPDHPHCTHWVLPGAAACAVGHAQEQERSSASSFGLLAQLRAARQRPDVAPAHPPGQAAPATCPVLTGPTAADAPDTRARRAPIVAGRAEPVQPYLHVSGFDPRAAGGRQALRLDLRALPDDGARTLTLHLQSALLPGGTTELACARALHGQWRPVFVEFSSRGMEHGQYRIDVELRSVRDGRSHRRWACTLVVLVPRADASLTEIHQTFLATHKNVRVHADDAAIARVQARTAGGRLDIDVQATNAAIAHLDLEQAGGKVDLAFPTIAWDEDLIELDIAAVPGHDLPLRAACIVNAAPQAHEQRHLRLFTFDAGAELVLGRRDAAPQADILLAHFSAAGPDDTGLTRRISGRHAIVRRTAHGFEIEDISRYGMLIDGVWPGKYVPVAVRAGMRIELTASIKGVATLEVSAVLAHALVLRRVDHGACAECLYLMAPDTVPPHAPAPVPVRGAPLPLLFHSGGFWHRDPARGQDTALEPRTQLARLAAMPTQCRFAPIAYPEHAGMPVPAAPTPAPARARPQARPTTPGAAYA